MVDYDPQGSAAADPKAVIERGGWIPVDLSDDRSRTHSGRSSGNAANGEERNVSPDKSTFIRGRYRDHCSGGALSPVATIARAAGDSSE
jgi:hypothetical protein